jgi:hypothetical protein
MAGRLPTRARAGAPIADLRQFTGAAWEQEDDITLVALQCFALLTNCGPVQECQAARARVTVTEIEALCPR